MRNRIIRWIAMFLALAGASSASAQEVIPRPFVGPLSHTRYEEGGIFTALEFLYWRQTNPIQAQRVAVRGFLDVDGSITGSPGSFVGSGEEALNTSMLRAPNTGSFTPGFNLTLGYRFENGLAIMASWRHLGDFRTNNTAALFSPSGNIGNSQQNTFLFAPVFNLPPQFEGNRNVNIGNPLATNGVFNAASIMRIEFKQRFEVVDVLGRIPISGTESENCRSYGIFGPRTIIMWERFQWHTDDIDILGDIGGPLAATYDNVVSNRLYGFVVGMGGDVRLGDSPIGTFSLFYEGNAGLFADFVKARARYQLDDKTISVHRNRNLYSVVPGVDLKFGMQWYLYEAITVRFGYNYMGLLNTIYSPRPIDFNAGTLSPVFSHKALRNIDGFDFGIGLVW